MYQLFFDLFLFDAVFQQLQWIGMLVMFFGYGIKIISVMSQASKESKDTYTKQSESQDTGIKQIENEDSYTKQGV
jgi:hypothetical protein